MSVFGAYRACGLLYRFIKEYPGLYLIPANVCPVVPLTFMTANVPFHFVDIDEDTLCIDEKQVFDELVSQKAKGLVYVRTYGYCSDTNAFFKSLKEHNNEIRIVDDRCLCAPDLNVETGYADMVLYSTGYAKQIDLGYGGYAVIRDDLKLYGEVEQYKGVDIEKVYKEAFRSGLKMNDVPSGWLNTSFLDDNVLSGLLRQLESKKQEVASHKIKINTLYLSELSGLVDIMPDSYQQWRFNILTNQKKQILQALFKNGLFASSHYCPSSRLFDSEVYECSERLFSRVVNLFNDMHYTEEQAAESCSIIKRVLSS